MLLQPSYSLEGLVRSMVEKAGYCYEQLAAEAANMPPIALNIQKSDWRDEEGILRDVQGRQKATKPINGVEFPILYGDEDYSSSVQDKRNFIAALRRECFRDGFQDFSAARFSNLAEDTDEKIATLMLEYVRDFKVKAREGKGLLLLGAYGVGKTHFAACICNTLLEDGKRCKMTSIDVLTDEHYSVKSELKKLCKNTLVVIDDFGAERDTQTAQNNTFQVLKRLNEQKIPFIVTSNLTLEQVLKPSTRNERVLDRIKHRNAIIEIKGRNRRDVRGRLF